MKLKRTEEVKQTRRNSGAASVTQVQSLVYDTGKGKVDIYPMIKGLAKKLYKGDVGSITFQDLIGAGLKGFSEALSKWDRRKKVKLTTFAHPRILGEMLDLLSREARYENNNDIREPEAFLAVTAPDHFEERASNNLLFLRVIEYMEEELCTCHKVCLVRFYLEGVPEREIAAELGISAAEAAKFRKEALALLRDRFAKYRPAGAGDWISG